MYVIIMYLGLILTLFKRYWFLGMLMFIYGMVFYTTQKGED